MSILFIFNRKGKKSNKEKKGQSIFDLRASQMGWDKKPLFKGPRTQRGKQWFSSDDH